MRTGSARHGGSRTAFGPRALLLVVMWAGGGSFRVLLWWDSCWPGKAAPTRAPWARQLLGRGICWCIAPDGRRSRVDVDPSFRWRAFLIRPVSAPRVPGQCTRDPICATNAGRYGRRSPPSCFAPPDTHPEAVAQPACCALTQNKHALGGFASPQ